MTAASIDFCTTEIFFFFVVGRNSVSFAPRAGCKSFVALWLAHRGGAKLAEFRPGGGAKLFPAGALFT
jgi:hypothetical protein